MSETFFRYLFGCLLIVFFYKGTSQETTIRYFGFMDASQEFFKGEKPTSGLSIGEHDLFFTSDIDERFNILGETVINIKSDGSFNVSMERIRVKYAFNSNHSLILGKMHTPINYWNDVYHHGRLFFPAIDRPHYFSLIVPIHTTGIRLQGQNIGSSKFGYDLVLGNGMSSTDAIDRNQQKSFTAAVHTKPIEGMRIGLSYFRDVVFGNSVGSHSGHSEYINHAYMGRINYNLYSFSFANFQDSWETLIEVSFNRNNTVLSGIAKNEASYVYLGKRLNEKNVLYTHYDYASIGRKDLHNVPLQLTETAIGLRHELSYLMNFKVELEYERVNFYEPQNIMLMHRHSNEEGLKIDFQLTYGF